MVIGEFQLSGLLKFQEVHDNQDGGETMPAVVSPQQLHL